MGISKYNDFHLQIDEGLIKATYLRAGTDNKVDRRQTVSADAHFDFKEYYNKIRSIESEDIESLNPKSYLREHLDLGGTLFSFLFPKNIADYFHASYDDSKDKDGKSGLRLRLEISHKILSNVAWEFVYDDYFNTYLCTEVTTPFTRYYGGLEPLAIALNNDDTNKGTQQDITAKALFISANAVGDTNIKSEEEYERIKEQISEVRGRIKIEHNKAKPPSWDRVHDELFSSTYNIVHFYGHGIFTGEKVQLIFESADKKAKGDPVDPGRFAALFDRRKSKDLCLILINACQGATTSESNPRSGLAHNLVTNSLGRVRAVIAMQFPITADAAGAFAQRLYGYLSTGNAIDEAMQIARQHLYGSYEYNKFRFFATPVLFLTSPTGYIFSRLVTIQKPPSPDDAREMLEALDNNYTTFLKKWSTDKDIKLEEFWAFENKGNLLLCLRFFQKHADILGLTDEQEKRVNEWLTNIPLKIRQLMTAEQREAKGDISNLQKEIMDIYGSAQLLLLNLFKKYGNEARYRSTSSKLQTGDSNISVTKIDAILEFYNMIDQLIYIKSLVNRCLTHRQKQDVLALIAEGYQKPIADFRISVDKWMNDLGRIPVLQRKLTSCQTSLSEQAADLDKCFADIKLGIDSINNIMDNLTNQFKELWRLTITTMVEDRIKAIQQ